MNWVNDYINEFDWAGLKKQFEGADPFNHIVLDDFLKYEIAKDLSEKFPEPGSDWYQYQNIFERKRAQDDLSKIPQEHAFILMLLNSRVFTEKLELLTGVSGIISDPWLRGGGLHQIERGGHLDVHADFNWHTHLKLHRKFNALLYLNKNYDDLYGGELELWSQENGEAKGLVKKVLPKFNRLVIFQTDSLSFHGHPNPWNGPQTRRSLAWYFYVSSSEEPKNRHSTLFKKLPYEETTPEIEALREKRNKGRI